MLLHNTVPPFQKYPVTVHAVDEALATSVATKPFVSATGQSGSTLGQGIAKGGASASVGLATEPRIFIGNLPLSVDYDG